MESRNKQLRSGYTTGACAAAAAKAAVMLLLSSECGSRLTDCRDKVRSSKKVKSVEIPFPDGSRVQFGVRSAECRVKDSKWYAAASVVKDAGDDPDITNGAEIVATACFSVECGAPPIKAFEGRLHTECTDVIIHGGKGVGVVTKPGLAIPVGEPAINPVPRRMITDAVREAVSECGVRNAECGVENPKLEITISVPAGEELAKKTLNHRLGIVGGISILGTTGIVKPLSEAAWTATITSSFDVAKAAGRDEVVLSTGRTSEKAHQNKYNLPEDCYAMMGDYTEFSLKDAKKHGFKKIHLCAQWAKMVKIAMETPETHVRHGAIEANEAASFLRTLGIAIPELQFNTVREIYDYLIQPGANPSPPRLLLEQSATDGGDALEAVCEAAKRYGEAIASGIPVQVHLVSYEGAIVAESE